MSILADVQILLQNAYTTHTDSSTAMTSTYAYSYQEGRKTLLVIQKAVLPNGPHALK